MRFHRFIVSILVIVMSLSLTIKAYADGASDNDYQSVQADINSKLEIMSDITAKSALVYEISTGTVICEKESNVQLRASHFTKLMTLLLTEEKVTKGELKFKDKATVSANANSKGAPQIWVDVGESITVDELIKSITIGNANDACTVLAEKIGGTEQDFVKLMNDKATSLGMNNTSFYDCAGESENTVTTTYDLALLSKEILKYDKFADYFTTWMTNVRNESVELVSTNRLIRTYKGITGLKSCSSKETGTSLIATAERANMSLCVVLVGCMDEDKKFNEAKKLLDFAFENYEIYEPEVDKNALSKIMVKGGEKLKTDVIIKNATDILIPKGTYSQIISHFKRKDVINAPAPANSEVGSIVYTDSNGKKLLECKIVLKYKVKKNSIWHSFKRILFNLLY